MAKPRVRFEVLAEDEETQGFVRRFLMERGVNNRDLFLTSLPVGGSGKKWVDDKYPELVKSVRSRNYQSNLALIVMTDADELTVSQRLQNLEHSLELADVTPRAASDRIAILIPRWHVETWYLFLAGEEQVDEDTHCKDLFQRRIARDKPQRQIAIRQFCEYYRQYLQDEMSSRDSMLPSILCALREAAIIPL